jgi:hypothetical protein
MADDEPEIVDVMLGEVGDKPMNTLMLERTDVVVPLERDLDGDPFQDDEVWLCTEDGTLVRRLYSSDEEVEEDEENRLLLYRFNDLRYGVYGVWTKIGGQAVEVLRGLVVRREGVFMNGEVLGENREGSACAPEPDHGAELGDDGDDAQEEGDDDQSENQEHVDQSDDDEEDTEVPA